MPTVYNSEPSTRKMQVNVLSIFEELIAMRAKTTFPAVISYWKGIETKMIWWACTTIMLAKVSPYEIFISKRYTKDLFIYHSWIKKHIYRAVSVQTNV